MNVEYTKIYIYNKITKQISISEYNQVFIRCKRISETSANHVSDINKICQLSKFLKRFYCNIVGVEQKGHV